MKISKFHEIIFLVLLAAIFFSISTISLESPGLGDEEAFLVQPAASIVEKNIAPSYLGLRLFGRDYFAMTNAWVGPISALLFVPSLYVFGISIYVIRITRIFFGFITILILYFFAREFFGRKTAATASFLLSTFPFYIFMYRQGYLDDGILPVFLLADLLCFYKFYKNPKDKFLYWGALFTGLGLCSKITFLWLIAAIPFCLLFFKIRPRLTKRNIILSFLIFNLAVLPMTLYNIKNINFINTTDSNTIGAIINNLVITRGGHNNLFVHKNILIRFRQLEGIFSNWYNGQRISTNPFYFYIFIVALGFYLARFLFVRRDKFKDKTMFIAILFLILFFFSCFTINYFKIEHAAIYLPLCVLIIVKFLEDVFTIRLKIVQYAVILFITIVNLVTLSKSYNILHKKGLYLSQFNWIYPSSAVYELSEYLANNGINKPIAIGPELVCNIEILTQGRVHPESCLNNSDDYERTKLYLEKSVWKDKKYYMFLAHGFARQTLIQFEALILKYTKSADIVKIFYRRDGVPDIILFKLKDGQYNNELSHFITEG